MLSVFAILPLFALPAVISAAVSTEPIKATWYAGWHAEDVLPPSSVSWDKYNTVYYSFAIPTSSGSLTLDGSDGEMLPDFVSQAHAHGVEAHIAIGGWTGSVYFSDNIATPANRTAFVKTVIDFVTKYSLDGVQIDWEYPNLQGVGCNTISPNDTANLLSFFEELRDDPFGGKLTLSAAVALTPFFNASGSPSTDVSGFADVLDYIAVMNYDVYGPWSTVVGANAPLNDSCAAPADQQGSAVSAVKAWTDAGMPVNKIVLGVAGYGHSFSVTPSAAFGSDSSSTLTSYPAFNASNQPLGDAWDSTGGVDICGVYEGPGGTFNFWGLIANGFLTEDGAPVGDIFYRYDECSQTPYVYNKTSQVMVSFDNAQSFAAKGNYIKETGLLGYAFWEAASDYNNILVDAINDAVEC